MPISYTHTETKNRIIATIEQKGPSLPVHIARAINVSPLFAGAFLSELYEEGKLRMSQMRVGSSPLYLLPGQEPQLEPFISFLNQKEKEALAVLKERKVVADRELPPAIRVALRAVPDFAVPTTHSDQGEPGVIWRYFTASETESQKTPSKDPVIDSPSREAPEPAKLKTPANPPEIPLKKRTSSENILREPLHLHAPAREPQTDASARLSAQVEEVVGAQLQLPKSPPKQKPVLQDSPFQTALKEYLAAQEISLLEVLLDKKKEIIAKVALKTVVGTQEYYLHAKDKKKITEADISLAVFEATKEKMPALIIAPGTIDKKALAHAQTWRNLCTVHTLKS